MSSIADSSPSTSAMIRNDSVDDSGSKPSSVTHRLRFVFLFLGLLGFFPKKFRDQEEINRRYSSMLSFIFPMSSLSIFIINIWLFREYARAGWHYKIEHGMLHADTVYYIIAGVKPLINCASFVVFFVNTQSHRKLLQTLDSVDSAFRSAFGKTPNVNRMSAVMLAICALAFFVIQSVRVVEYHLVGVRLGEDFLTDVTLILVPMLSVWNIVPLLYYNLMNCIVRSWCRILRQELIRSQLSKQYNLRFYYQYFLKIISVQDCISNLFNPLILFSFGWTLYCLCLTIYYITQATTDVPSFAMWKFVWLSLHIAVAIGYIFTISGTGIKTNEETRTLLDAVLTLVPDVETEEDRFQVTCFVHLTNTQNSWGMTVWGAYQLERGWVFTLVGLIFTYAFLLFDLKSKHVSSTKESADIQNSTYASQT